MTLIKTKVGRRSFLKTSALAGGGIVVGFSWLASCTASKKEILQMPKEWFEINGFLKIGDNGLVTIMSPNPEIGQNVKTSMPMLVAEELDVDWDNIIVEQAPLNTKYYQWQVAGGSRSISSSWNTLRMAGATARRMLIEAAAQEWKVPVEEITTELGMLHHKKSGKSAHYGKFASAAVKIPVPTEVKLKEVKDFKIIGTSRKNVDGKNIVTGKPLFGLDYKKEGMLIAMVVHPPAFGLKLKSVENIDEVKSMPGVKDVFTINTNIDNYEKSIFDGTSFYEMAVVVGNSTWEVLNAKNKLKIEWEQFKDYEENYGFFGNRRVVKIPSGLENTTDHKSKMAELSKKQGTEKRKNGNPQEAFKKADQILERTYTTPYLAHNTMEPMNFFAHVTGDKAVLVGPTQTPEFMEKSISAKLGIPLENIDIQLTRMGGGFGRRLYGHFMVEAAVISQKMNAPIKIIYTREDDMTMGNYRPSYSITYRAALDKNKNLIGFHVKGGGMTESSVFPDRFPAGAIDNYLAEEWSIPSNISIGAFRAPRSNFTASAEQSFLDELAEIMGKDPIDFRLELMERAKSNPVGEKNEYDPSRYAGVLQLVKEKSGWGQNDPADVHRGVAAYFCHNTYVAQVVDLVIEDGKPIVKKVHCAVDCGIVVNPIASTNLIEGGSIDGIGHALYSKLTFNNGATEQSNFNKYRLIRHSEAPKSIDVHFVKNEIDPTGLGEPMFPPVMGALANALYKATGKRVYDQPYFA